MVWRVAASEATEENCELALRGVCAAGQEASEACTIEEVSEASEAYERARAGEGWRAWQDNRSIVCM